MNTNKSTSKAKAVDPMSTTGRVPRIENTTDATRGQPLVQRVQARRAELQTALAALPADESRESEDLALAIAGADSMLTGDLDHVPDVVAADMSHWLERNKHLAESTPAVRAKGTKKKSSS